MYECRYWQQFGKFILLYVQFLSYSPFSILSTDFQFHLKLSTFSSKEDYN